MFLLKFLASLAFILISVAFFTLLEQKFLGYSHNRFAPNKLIIFGLSQPFSDAIKLFSKLDIKVSDLFFFLFMFSPLLGLFLSLFLWGLFPFYGLLFFSFFSSVLFLLLSGFSIFFLLFSGWCTSTKYSMLGSYRSSSQSVSYEVIMMLVILTLVFLYHSIDLMLISSLMPFNTGFFTLFGLTFCWALSCVAECNRSPFDFSEGESELVSGFNTEYGGGLFSLIFIAEYSSIIFLSFLTSLLFFSSFVFLLSIVICFFYLWLRCSFPRLRYDLLMMFSWSSLMFICLGYFYASFFLFV